MTILTNYYEEHETPENQSDLSNLDCAYEFFQLHATLHWNATVISEKNLNFPANTALLNILFADVTYQLEMSVLVLKSNGLFPVW